jgi:opacity protein-like surface antigen
MKKILGLMLALSLLALPAFSQIEFKDVPDDHWAASAVYDLVKLGVTQGYPDGTFRGKKNITRYETAIFVSKLAKVLQMGEDYSDEIEALRKEIAGIKRFPVVGEMPISGKVEMVGMLGNLLATGGTTGKGPVTYYRLQTGLNSKVNDKVSVSINLDTMDSGYYGGSYMLPTQLIDITAKLKVDPAEVGLDQMGLGEPLMVSLTSGPGAIQHTDGTGFLPSETGVTYDRPDNGVAVATKLYGADVEGEYVAVNKRNTGKVDTNQVTGKVAYTFAGVPYLNSLKVEAVGDYYAKNPNASNSIRDLRAAINVAAPLSSDINAKATFGMGKSERKGWMVEGELELADVWKTGTEVFLKGAKVGSEFITTGLEMEQFDAAGYDVFSRPLEAAQVDLGGVVKQNVTDKLALEGKGDIRLAPDFKYETDKASLTAQLGVKYEIAPNTSLDAYYRYHQEPEQDETTDLTAVGLVYKF